MHDLGPGDGRSILHGRLVSVLDWASSLLASAVAGPEYWAPDADEAVRPIDKMVIEAALLAYVAERALGPDQSVLRLLDSVAARTEELNRVYELICRQPFLWTSIGLVWVVLDSFDVGDPVRRRKLRTLWSEEGGETAQPSERVVYRILDQAWVRSVARSGRDPQLDSRGLLSATSLYNLREGLFMSVSDLYALTHSAMYVSDFGRRPLPPVAADWIGPLALSRLLLGDFDLAIELALADALASPGEPHVGSVVTAAAAASMFGHLGFVPAPSLRADGHRAASSPQDYLAYHSYHTTFVFGLLCAVASEQAPAHSPLADALASPSQRPAEEWDARRLGESVLSARIVHAYQSWLPFRGPAHSDEQLLRGVLDAFILDAASALDLPEMLSLAGMASVAGPSAVDTATRQYLKIRATLATDSDQPSPEIVPERTGSWNLSR